MSHRSISLLLVVIAIVVLARCRLQDRDRQTPGHRRVWAMVARNPGRLDFRTATPFERPERSASERR